MNKKNTLTLLKNNEAKKKRIGVFDRNTGAKICEYESIRECNRYTGFDRKIVSQSANGKNVYSYGYNFKFV